MYDFIINRIGPQDLTWIRQLMHEQWGSELVIVHDQFYLPEQLPGFIAVYRGRRSGLITYSMKDSSCEIVTLNSLVERIGIGTALIQQVQQVAIRHQFQRIWLITTNDNTPALEFYQKQGFRLVTIHRDAVTRARLKKPEIPMLGFHCIPICDEIELEFILNTSA